MFTRESQSGYSVTAYWLGKNIVNIIDVFVISIFYFTFFFIITTSDYRYVQGAGVYLFMAWFTSKVSHFFSVTLDPAMALLIAVMVPCLYTSMFGEVKPQLSPILVVVSTQ